MSLFGSMQIGKNALSAAQLGLQVAGNNIANAHTPDYLRQDLELRTTGPQRIGGLLLGTGVEVHAIYQHVDKFLEERLRGAASELAKGEAQEKAYIQLENLLGELSDTDLSTSMNRFFGAIHDVVNQPEKSSVRNLAVLAGANLTADIRRLDDRVREARTDLNEQIGASAEKINQLTEEIAQLNLRIVRAEGGGAIPSDAVGLRDQRQRALSQLAQLIDVRAVEQTSGAVNVFAGGEFLIFDGQSRRIVTEESSDRSLQVFDLRIEATDAPLHVSGGDLGGMLAARDEVLGGFLDGLDEFAKTLLFEFNRVHAGGQGLTGFTSLTSEFAATDPDAPLDQAGLPFTPDNGTFQVLVRDRNTGLVRTTDVTVALNGLPDDATQAQLVQQLGAIDGLTAEITRNGEVALRTEAPHLEFAFASDSSGALAALGLNTFFTGASARDIGVSRLLHQDPGKFAASQGGIGQGATNAERLAVFLDAQLASQDGASISLKYESLVASVAQKGAASRAATEGYRAFKTTLEGQKLATSGVSLDEEAVRMIAFQRTFQASARFISTVNELLQTLINL